MYSLLVNRSPTCLKLTLGFDLAKGDRKHKPVANFLTLLAELSRERVLAREKCPFVSYEKWREWVIFLSKNSQVKSA